MTTNAQNSVEPLLSKLELDEYFGVFAKANVETISELRSLSDAQLQDLVPNEIQRKKLLSALATNRPPKAAEVPHADDEHDASHDDRGTRGGSNFDGSRRPHRAPGTKHSDQSKAGGAGSSNYFRDDEGRDSFRLEVVVPGDQIKWLLGFKAFHLCNINRQCGTSNSRIERADTYTQYVSFEVFGPTLESVTKARAEILRVVGVTRSETLKARFNYVTHELEMNKTSALTACVANLRNRGTPLELSSDVIRRLVNTMKFAAPQRIKHLWALSGQMDKEKYEILSKVTAVLKGSQVIVFTEPKRVDEMAKHPHRTAKCFGVKQVQFISRSLTKAERYQALADFKRGEANAHGVKCRVLVTTIDYAKLARKIVVPYVNLIVHLAMPRNKEVYLLQALCAGRNGYLGISFIFVTQYDVVEHKELQDDLPLEEFQESTFSQIAEELKYDTEAEPLTDANADPPDNWKELINVTRPNAS